MSTKDTRWCGGAQGKKKKLNVFILNTTQPYIEVLKID
jgi:hypothetical protein